MTRFWMGISICLLLAVGLIAPLAAQSNVSDFTNIRASGWMRAGSDIEAGGDVDAGGNVAFGEFLVGAMPTPIAVTAGGVITPNGSNLLLTSAGNVGTRLIVTTTVDDGTWLFIQNVGSNTITLTDTAPLVLGGNAALGANDTLIVRLRNGSWVQFSKTDN